MAVALFKIDQYLVTEGIWVLSMCVSHQGPGSLLIQSVDGKSKMSIRVRVTLWMRTRSGIHGLYSQAVGQNSPHDWCKPKESWGGVIQLRPKKKGENIRDHLWFRLPAHFIGTVPQELGDHFQSLVITGNRKLMFMLTTIPTSSVMAAPLSTAHSRPH